MEKKGRIVARRNELSQGRKEQVAIAGNTTPESIQAQIQAAIAADAKRWQASDKCNPDAISQPMTRAFCEGIHQLEAKKAAAIKRDEIDRQLAIPFGQHEDIPCPKGVDRGFQLRPSLDGFAGRLFLEDLSAARRPEGPSCRSRFWFWVETRA
jgi:hypothetical protein